SSLAGEGAVVVRADQQDHQADVADTQPTERDPERLRLADPDARRVLDPPVHAMAGAGVQDVEPRRRELTPGVVLDHQGARVAVQAHRGHQAGGRIPIDPRTWWTGARLFGGDRPASARARAA